MLSIEFYQILRRKLKATNMGEKKKKKKNSKDTANEKNCVFKVERKLKDSGSRLM